MRILFLTFALLLLPFYFGEASHPLPQMVLTCWAKPHRIIVGGSRFITHGNRFIVDDYRFIIRDHRFIIEGGRIITRGSRFIMRGHRIITHDY